ncbi:aldose epimerase family protein [Nocardioides sp.]|uniref:aldose epimerase family protein n=1 Tax=Nocardioides sp. TaxID=35761 RepID=UPI002ED03577
MTGPLRIGGGDGLVVEVAPLGARITSIQLLAPRAGVREVTRGIASDQEYLASSTYQGCTVGRVANRIAGGDLPLDGRRYPLATNDLGNTLHGGPDGFDRRTWDVVEHAARRVALALVSPDGDQGFPGTVRVRATFEVDGPVLRTSYDAETDAPTALSLASHPYFSLTESVADHRLRVVASSYLPVDATGVPTDIASVAGSAYDLREPARVDPAFDHCWLLDGTGFREVAELTGGGLSVTLATDQPGLQVYAGGGEVSGIALEPQGLPDAVHHPEWPSVVLRPGEQYRWRSEITVRPVTTRP